MPLSITSVITNPAILYKGQTDVSVQATVASAVGVSQVLAVAYDPSIGIIGYGAGQVSMTLASGNNLNGIYKGTLVIAPDIKDGLYQISVQAVEPNTGRIVRGSATDTWAVNDESALSVERNVSGPGGPGGPGEPGEKEECSCKVSINVTAGPVNIYVCGSETNSNIPV